MERFFGNAKRLLWGIWMKMKERNGVRWHYEICDDFDAFASQGNDFYFFFSEKIGVLIFVLDAMAFNPKCG